MGTTIAPAAKARRTPLPLRALHLLSLDAPAVAVVWLYALAAQLHMRVPAHAAVALGCAVWMIYAADRLLDVRSRGERRTMLQERHRFAAQYARIFLTTIVLMAGLLLALLVYDTQFASRQCLAGDVWLGLALSGYFAFEHFLPARVLRFWAGAKNAAMALLFAAAIALPVVAIARSNHAWGYAAMLAALCWFNCRLIAAWEMEERAIAVPKLVAWASCAVAIALCIASHRNLAATAILGASLLLVLNAERRRFAPLTLRAVADIAVLTPVLTILSLR